MLSCWLLIWRLYNYKYTAMNECISLVVELYITVGDVLMLIEYKNTSTASDYLAF